MKEVGIIEKDNKGEQSERSLENMSRCELEEMKKDLQPGFVEKERAEGILAELDSRFDEVKQCAAKMANVIGECQELLKVEQQKDSGNVQHSRKNSTSTNTCKTNVVSPMIGGIPLKRARISLERLGPAPYNLSQFGKANNSQEHGVRSSNRVQPEASDGSEIGRSSSRRAQQDASNASEPGPSSSRGHRSSD